MLRQLLCYRDMKESCLFETEIGETLDPNNLEGSCNNFFLPR